MKSRAIAWKALLFSCFILVSIGCTRGQYDIKQVREGNSRQDASVLFAQSRLDIPERPLNLQDILSIAFKRNLNLLAYEQEYLVQKETTVRSQFGKFPSATGNIDRTHRFNEAGSRSISPVSGESTVPSRSGSRNTYKSDLSLLWSALDFGVTHFRFRQAKNQFKILSQRHKRLKQNLILDLITAYWQTVIAQKATEGAEIVLVLTEKRQADLTKQIKSQFVSEIEGLENQRRLIETQLRLKSYQKELEASKGQLLQLMGLPPGTDFDLAYVEIAKVNPIKYNLKKLEEKALLFRPELYSLDLEEKVHADEVRASIVGMFPNAQAVGGYQYDQNRLLENNYWSTVGAKAAWNLFSIPSQERNMMIASRQGALARFNRLALSVGVMSQVNLAHLELQDSYSQHALAKTLFETKERLLEVGRIEQRQGVFDAADILELESEALFSEIFSTTTYAEMQIALAKLGNSYGNPLAFVDLQTKELGFVYQDLVNMTLPSSHMKAGMPLDVELLAKEDGLEIEAPLTADDQARRFQMLESARDHAFFDSTLRDLSGKQLNSIVSHTKLLTEDSRAKKRIEQLSAQQLHQLHKENSNSFSRLVTAFTARQIRDVVSEYPDTFSEKDVSNLSFEQLVALQELNDQAFTLLVSGLNIEQFYSLMDKTSLFLEDNPQAALRVSKLSQKQLEQLYASSPNNLKRIFTHLTGQQVNELIGRESINRGVIVEWKQEDLPGIIDGDIQLITRLTFSQLNALYEVQPKKFDQIMHQLSTDQVLALVHNTPLLTLDTLAAKRVEDLGEQRLLDIFSKDSTAFNSIVHHLSILQLYNFIDHTDIFSDSQGAMRRVQSLSLEQLKQLHRKSEDSLSKVIVLFSGNQFGKLLEFSSEVLSPQLVQKLSRSQLQELASHNREQFNHCIPLFSIEQLVDLIYNGSEFTDDVQISARLQKLSVDQILSLNKNSPFIFTALLSYLTDEQLVGLVDQAPESLLFSESSPYVRKEGDNLALRLHFLRASQLKVIYEEDPYGFEVLVGDLSASQVKELFDIDPSLFSKEVVRKMRIQQFIALDSLEPNYFDLLVDKLTSDQLMDLIDNTKLLLENERISSRVRRLTSTQLTQLHEKSSGHFADLLTYLNGNQIDILVSMDARFAHRRDSYVSVLADQDLQFIRELTTEQIESLHQADPKKVDSFVSQFSSKQLASLLLNSDIFSEERASELHYEQILSLYKEDEKAFAKVLPLLSIKTIQRLFETSAIFIKEKNSATYVASLAPMQLKSLQDQSPAYFDSVVSKMTAQQLSSLAMIGSGKIKTQNVRHISREVFVDLNKIDPAYFDRLIDKMSAHQIKDLIENSTHFHNEAFSGERIALMHVEQLMNIKDLSPFIFTSLLSRLSVDQIIALLDIEEDILMQTDSSELLKNGQINRLRVSLLEANQLNQLAQKDEEKFVRHAPLLRAQQIKALLDQNPQAFTRASAGVLKADQIIHLNELELAYVDQLLPLFGADLIAQLLDQSHLLIKDGKATERLWHLSAEQLKELEREKTEHFVDIIAYLNDEQVQSMIQKERYVAKGWFGFEKKQVSLGVLNGNARYIQRLSVEQLLSLSRFSAKQFEGFIPYLSGEQLLSLIQETELLTQERIQNLAYEDLMGMHREDPLAFNSIIAMLSLKQNQNLIEKRAIFKDDRYAREHVQTMTSQQLADLRHSYPKDFTEIVADLSVKQLTTLLDWDLRYLIRQSVQRLSLQQILAIDEYDPAYFDHLIAHLNISQLRQLIEKSSLFTKTPRLEQRVQNLTLEQLKELNKSSPTYFDHFINQLGQEQMHELARIDVKIFTEKRIQMMNGKQLEVLSRINKQIFDRSLSDLSEEQLEDLFAHSSVFSGDLQAVSSRIRQLKPDQVLQISKLNPQFVSSILSELTSEQLMLLSKESSLFGLEKQGRTGLENLTARQISHLYRVSPFFTTDPDAQVHVQELSAKQLTNLAQVDREVFDALFKYIHVDQFISLMKLEKTPIRLENIHTLSLEMLQKIDGHKEKFIAYPRQTFFDAVIPYLSAEQMITLVKGKHLIFDQDFRIGRLTLSQLEEFFHKDSENFLVMVEHLSLEQLGKMLSSTDVFKQTSGAESLMRSLKIQQLQGLLEKDKRHFVQLVKYISTQQLQELLSQGRDQILMGKWVDFLQDAQLTSLASKAPQEFSHLIASLKVDQVKMLMDQTPTFTTSRDAKKYTQLLQASQLDQFNHKYPSYFESLVENLSGKQLAALITYEQRAKGNFISRLLKKSDSQDKKGYAVIANDKEHIFKLSIDQLEAVYQTDPQRFARVFVSLDFDQVFQIIEKTSILTQASSAKDLVPYISFDKVEKLYTQHDESFKKIVSFLGAKQIKELISRSIIFSREGAKETIQSLDTRQVAQLQSISMKSFIVILQYLSFEQMHDLVQKTQLLTDDKHAYSYMQYFKLDQLLALSREYASSFDQLVPKMDLNQLVSLLSVKQSPMNSRSLQQLTLEQLVHLHQTYPGNFYNITKDLASHQLAKLLEESNIFTQKKTQEQSVSFITASQLQKLEKQYSQAFKKLLPYLNGEQLARLINIPESEGEYVMERLLTQLSDSQFGGTIGGNVRYVQALSMQQLHELYQKEPERFTAISIGLSDGQMMQLIENTPIFTQDPLAVYHLSRLQRRQFEHLASAYPKQFIKIVRNIGTDLLDDLISYTQIFTGGKGAKEFVDQLSVDQLKKVSVRNSSHFNLVLKLLDQDFLERLVLAENTQLSPQFIQALNEKQLLALYRVSPERFDAMFEELNLSQIIGLIQNTGLFTKEAVAASYVRRLELKQLQDINQANPKFFDAIIPHLTAQQVQGLMQMDKGLFTAARMRMLNHTQISSQDLENQKAKR